MLFARKKLDPPDDPFNWPLAKRWKITLVALFATLTTLINGTIITVASESINEALHESDASFPNSYWPTTSWTLGGAVCSILVLPMFEDFGIRPGFLGTYVVFILFIIPQGVAQNFATLVVTRFFTGGCVSILANTSASVIGNVWNGERERSIPMSLYSTTYLVGLSVGPVIGGVILENLGWRWISYLQVIWHGLFFPFYYFLLEETRGGLIAKHSDADGNGADTKDVCNGLLQRVCVSVKRPLYMLSTEPVLIVFSLWSAFAVGTVFLFTQSIAQVYSTLYGFTASQAGYIQAAVVVGMCVGWSLTLINRRFYLRSALYNTEMPGCPVPEARLYTSTVGSLVGVTGGMFVYGWTSYSSIPWIAPTIGLAMVGTGIGIVVIAAVDYITDAYAKYAASAIAAAVLVEDVVAGFLPLAAQSMYTNLGFQWASTLLGFISLLLSSAPVVLIIWGRRIRARSPFMKSALIEARTPVTVASVLAESLSAEGRIFKKSVSHLARLDIASY